MRPELSNHTEKVRRQAIMMKNTATGLLCHDMTLRRKNRVVLDLSLPKPGGHVLSPDFGQIQRWAVREMGLEDYTWKISEAALHGEFGLGCPCIFNYSRLHLRLKVRVCIVHGGDCSHVRKSLGL